MKYMVMFNSKLLAKLPEIKIMKHYESLPTINPIVTQYVSWLAVSTILKNISQLRLLFPNIWKVIKAIFQTTNQPVIFKN